MLVYWGDVSTASLLLLLKILLKSEGAGVRRGREADPNTESTGDRKEAILSWAIALEYADQQATGKRMGNASINEDFAGQRELGGGLEVNGRQEEMRRGRDDEGIYRT